MLSFDIPVKCKSLVTAYARNMERKLLLDHAVNGNNAFWHVPSQIIQLCIAYYYYCDRFIECGNKSIKLLNGGQTIANSDPNLDGDTAYGEFEIDCRDERTQNMAFRWTLYIHNAASDCISIGIDESKYLWINDNPNRKDRKESIPSGPLARDAENLGMLKTSTTVTRPFHQETRYLNLIP